MSFVLFCAILAIAAILTMVGLGGGLIFSPLFVIIGLPKTAAVSASLFLNLLAAGFITGMIVAQILKWEKLNV